MTLTLTPPDAVNSTHRTGKILTTGYSTQLSPLRHGKPIARYRLNKSVLRLDDHLAVAIDQAGLAVHVDLREAKLVVVHDTVLRPDDLASFFIDEAIETADADRRPVVRECADPIIARRHSDAAVAMDRAAQTARKHTRR